MVGDISWPPIADGAADFQTPDRACSWSMKSTIAGRFVAISSCVHVSETARTMPTKSTQTNIQEGQPKAAAQNRVSSNLERTYARPGGARQ